MKLVISLVLLLVFSGLLASDSPSPSTGENQLSYKQEIDQWRAKREKRLMSDDGWLTLVGLFWLNEGENKMGSDPGNTVIFPKDRSAPVVGSLWLEKGKVRIEAKPDSGITSDNKPVTSMALVSDADENVDPTQLHLNSLMFYIISRADKLGVRVKDSKNPAKIHFSGLQYFPTSTDWKIEAKLVPNNPPKKIPITNILGMTQDNDSPGTLVFQKDGKTYHLDALKEEDQLFILFKDQTSGKETYGIGRFVNTDAPDAQGKVILDFNKAYNPPCAFTSYATCPLPPPQNRLAMRVEAGEKKYTNEAVRK
ncbi:MAG TPA: DUF1684 domain-containing protein [Acidobacteriota bacterium]|nr:DUF1684 domain-containing protein [Acidobacteriota bacterium]